MPFFEKNAGILYTMAPMLLIGNLGGAEIIVMLILLLLPGILWIWILTDILSSNFKNSDSKIIWLLVVIFLSVMGCILYLIIGRSQKIDTQQPDK